MGYLLFFKTIMFLDKFNLFNGGYTILNSILYSIIGIFIYFFVAYPYLLLRKIKIDFKFILSVLIFVGIGGILRIFSQGGTTIGKIIISSNNPLSICYYFQFPQLFLLLGVLFIIFLETSLYLSKRFKTNYNKILQFLSLGLFIPLLLFVLIKINHWFIFLAIIFSVIVIFYLVYYLFKLFKSNLLVSKVSKLVLLSQTLDGIVTFTSIVFFKNQLIEQHPLSSWILAINPVLYVVIKILFSLFLIWIIDILVKKEFENNYFKLFIIIIGFTTGFRDLLTLSLLLL